MTIEVATLAAKDQIADCIHNLFFATDQRDWPKVRACFTNRVLFDMTSLAGGAPQQLTPTEIGDAWQKGLAALEHIHYQAGNLQISVAGDVAVAFCYGVALSSTRPGRVNASAGSTGTKQFP